MLSLLYLGVKAKQYFVCSRCIFLDKKTLLKIWLDPWFSPERGGGDSPIRGCAAGQGMVFVLFALKQGIQFCASLS